MNDFSPFSVNINLLFIASLIGSYLLGTFFYRSSNKIDELAMRLALGQVAGLVALAVIFSGTSTMAVIMLPILGYMSFKRFQPATKALDTERTVPFYEYISLALVAVAMFALDAFRLDIRQGDALLYIGNTDISYYGSTGRMMFEFGEETLPSSVGETPQKMIYHFGDMWLSGIYSYFFDVIPYYAYGILYRSVGSSILFLLLYSFFRKTGGLAQALGFSILGLVANSALLWYFPSFGLDVLQPFFDSWPIYAESSFLVLGIASLVFLKLFETGRIMEGMVGFLLAASLHSVFIVPSFIFACSILSVKMLFPKLLDEAGLPSSWSNVGMIALAGILPYAFVVADGRSLSLPMTLNTGLLYLVVHTGFRSFLTLVLLAPFLIGLIFLIIQKGSRSVSTVVLLYCLGGIAGFCLLFAVFQSTNTTKLFSGLLAALLFPFGLMGLSEMLRSKRRRDQTVAAVSIVLVLCSTLVGCIHTSFFESIYSWNHIKGHQEKWTLPKEEVVFLREKLSKGVYAGYAVCDAEEFPGDLIRYNSYIGINGLLDGGHIFRINAIATDTVCSKESKSWTLKSSPLVYGLRYSDSREAVKRYVEDLDITYVLRDSDLAGLCLPDEIGLLAQDSISTGRYKLYPISR